MDRVLIVFVLSLAVFLVLSKVRSGFAEGVVMALMTTGNLGKYRYLILATDIGLLFSVIAFVCAAGKLVMLFLG